LVSISIAARRINANLEHNKPSHWEKKGITLLKGSAQVVVPGTNLTAYGKVVVK
jgi:hypothetical protein